MKIIAGNWKMNPRSAGEANRLFGEITRRVPSRGVQVVICPPFPYLSDIVRGNKKKTVALGAQDAFWEPHGPYTGEVSPTALKGSGVEYVILGHSERRRIVGETDEMVGKKVYASLRAGLTVILCVGEPLSVRNKGKAAARRFIEGQLRENLRLLRGPHNARLTRRLIVAYEPVWAISTSQKRHNETPEDAASMIQAIKVFLFRKYSAKKPVVLYGGSVNKGNAEAFFSQEDIDGALVGGASLRASEFEIIMKCAVS